MPKYLAKKMYISYIFKSLKTLSVLKFGFCFLQQESAELGEILLSLSYLPTAERLTVVVMKAKDLRVPVTTPSSGEICSINYTITCIGQRSIVCVYYCSFNARKHGDCFDTKLVVCCHC